MAVVRRKHLAAVQVRHGGHGPDEWRLARGRHRVLRAAHDPRVIDGDLAGVRERVAAVFVALDAMVFGRRPERVCPVNRQIRGEKLLQDGRRPVRLLELVRIDDRRRGVALRLDRARRPARS